MILAVHSRVKTKAFACLKDKISLATAQDWNITAKRAKFVSDFHLQNFFVTWLTWFLFSFPHSPSQKLAETFTDHHAPPVHGRSMALEHRQSRAFPPEGRHALRLPQ